MDLFNSIYKNKKVLVTGHTGFKGSWISAWLLQMGAKVSGYSLAPQGDPNHFELLKLDMDSRIGDILDRELLDKTIQEVKPNIIIHMAAQSLVRLSYSQPILTFETNVIGTQNVFEAARKTPSVQAIVNITSDKCYENKEWVWGYRENDPMGGYDPYSASKGCAELLTNCYQNSFFNLKEYKKSHSILLASTRAGNVIGGGDWADDRLVPDIMRAISENKPVEIRSPHATRPWQHVLEPLSGYLKLGQKLLEENTEYAGGWNFGPDDTSVVSVEGVCILIKKYWDKMSYELHPPKENLHEANVLKLDSSKARTQLQWSSTYSYEEAIEATVSWYKQYYSDGKLNTYQDIQNFVKKAYPHEA